MSGEEQREYFLKRARECRELARKTTDRGIRRVHLDFAARYEDAVRAAYPATQRPTNAMPG